MVELRAIDDNTMEQSFAGDVYNSAVYLQRCFPGIKAGMVTAVGTDALSEKMIQKFHHESLDTTFVFQHKDKVPGLYLIKTDAVGERSFTYWRSDAAARYLMDFLSDDVAGLFKTGDALFISGISLAVITPTARSALWSLLQQLKSRGVTLIFDPNYRARLWSSTDEAITAFQRAFQLADIALPGVEDLEVLFGISNAEAAIEYCQSFGIREIVVKNGPESVLTYANGQLQKHPITPVTKVVDTTSAGDAFNGVYLGARIQNRSISDAVQLAATAAGTVIQHPGAIAPAAAFRAAMATAGI